MSRQPGMAEELLQSIGLGADGWGKFDGFDQDMKVQRQRLAEQMRADAAELAAVFGTHAGRRAVLALAREVLFQPHLLPLAGKCGAEQQALFAAYRQGQRDCVALLMGAVDTAAGVDPEVRKGEA